MDDKNEALEREWRRRLQRIRVIRAALYKAHRATIKRGAHNGWQR